MPLPLQSSYTAAKHTLRPFLATKRIELKTSGRGQVSGASPGRRSLWTALRLRTVRLLRARR